VKISKITPQKKNKKRSTIYINGDYAFGLSNEILLKHNLHEGDEIEDTTIQNVLLEQEKQRIRERVLRLLHYGRRSIKELKNRLLAIGFEEKLVKGVLDEFVRDDTLNDENFAAAFVADYTNLKPKGNIFIRRELTNKGVSAEIIDKVICRRDEGEIVESLLQSKLARFDLGDTKDRQKVLRRLLSRGFTPSIVFEKIHDYEK
jgi:regulatory protein